VTEPEEPTRWKHGAADAPDGFAELARADAQGGPAHAALSRVIEKLALQVSAPEIAHAFHAQASAPAAPATASRFGVLSKLVVAACVIGAIAIGLITLNAERRTPAQPPKPADRAVASEMPARPSAPDMAPAAAEPTTAAPRPEPAPAPSRPATPHRPGASATLDLTTELHLLELAQQALQGDPARALAIAERHRHRFAHGQFAQEREMLAIQALVALGQHDRAAARARAFARSYPDSSHLPHLRDLVPTTP
jgi:hypothetical protein